ncbi:MAG: helix-turn-helix transcriptional regulator [Verrucomicrobia bacterium]|nr:helix-turn-helix transcriptional regulator [Verrucomicrobiota bacterium]
MNNDKSVEQWRSACPVARTLDLLGDRWSLLIVRDMLFGSSKFQQFLASPENIPTNVLSSRLKMLESSGLIQATLYQRHPPRFAYTLTEKGKKLAPVIRAIADWGGSNIRNSREQGRSLST